MISKIGQTLLGLFLCGQVNADLYFEGQRDQVEKIFGKPDYLIEFQIANFGHVPWGTKVGGDIKYAHTNGCKLKDLQELKEEMLKENENDENNFQKKFTVLLDQPNDECSYVTQARNVEKIGAGMLIIQHDTDDNIYKVIISDDGTGAGIRIPAVVIKKTDGENLKKLLKNLKQKNDFTAWIGFPMVQHDDNTVTAEYWYTSSDEKSLDFIRNVARQIEPILEQGLNFEPKFVTWSCTHCDQDFKDENCISDGKYCAIKHSYNDELTGREIIMEDLRQYCLWKLPSKHESVVDKSMHDTMISDKTAYFWYVIRAHSLYKNRITEKNSQDLMKNLKINFDVVQACVAKTFDQEKIPTDLNQAENSVLKQFAYQWENFGSHLTPSLVINQRTFRGRLTADSAFEAICQSFKNEPSKCFQFQRKHHIAVPRTESTGINNKTLMYLIIVLVACNVVVIAVYRHFLNRELEDEMTIQVSSAVSQYVALSQIPELNKDSALSTETKYEISTVDQSKSSYKE